MPSVRLAKDMRLILDGRRCIIRGRVSDAMLCLEGIDDGEIMRISRTGIAQAIAEGRAELLVNLGEGPTAESLRRKLEADMTALSNAARAEISRRQAYVNAVAAERPRGLTKAVLVPIIDRIAEDRHDRRPPSWATLRRWYQAFERASGDARALLSSTGRRGNRNRKLPAEVIDAIHRAINERYLVQERPGMGDAHAQAVCAIDDLNRFRPLDQQLPLPSRRAFYRIVASMDGYEVTARRYGKYAADVKYRQSGQAPKPTRPLERVEMDHTICDVFLIDEHGMQPLGRPCLTLMVDVYSGMPIGFHIGYAPASWVTVMQCLRQAMLPKEALAERYPDTKHKWECHGVPETLILDNGREFHSQDLEIAAQQLGIQLQYATRRSPWLKGSVERFFRRMNDQLVHKLPGTTFSNIFARADYDPKKHAVLTVKEFTGLVYRWIVDDFAQDYHRGRRDIPARLWAAGVEEYPVRLPSSIRDFNIVLRSTEQRTVHHYGIELENLRYANEKLAEMRRAGPKSNPRVTVKCDPEDLSHIFVLNPATNAYFEVEAVDQDYTRDLSLWAHQIYVRLAREQVKGALSIVDLARARQAVTQKVQAVIQHKEKLSARQKVGRLTGVSSAAPDGTMSLPTGQAPTDDSAQRPGWEAGAPAAPIEFPDSSDPLPPDEDDDGWETDYNLPMNRK